MLILSMQTGESLWSQCTASVVTKTCPYPIRQGLTGSSHRLVPACTTYPMEPLGDMMLGMSDDHPRPDTGHLDMSSHGQTPDVSLDTAMSIRDTAARADVTEKTVRRWIKSGRLHAIKLGGQYRITVADLETARAVGDVHDVQVRSTQRLDTGHDSPSVDMSRRLDSEQGRQEAGPLDLRPLVDHIAALESQVQQLTEVSTMWQFRARQLEERLQAITAGENVPDTAPEPPGSTETSDTVLQGLRTWLRRLWPS